MSRGATVPVYSSRRSERVVLPWSMYATTEIARVRWVGVDTHGVYRGKKKGRLRGRPSRISAPTCLFARPEQGPVPRALGRAALSWSVGLFEPAHPSVYDRLRPR